MANLYFKYGAMNSRKSTDLLQSAHNYEENGIGIIVIKPQLDTKGNDKVVSRIGIERKVDFLIPVDGSVLEIIKHTFNRISCVFIDEAQFLEPNQVNELYIITKVYNIDVICYGLKNDFRTISFPGSIRLFELADSLTELDTICRCGNKATLSGRKIDGEFVYDGEQIVIDDDSQVSYESLCGNCYLTKVLKKEGF